MDLTQFTFNSDGGFAYFSNLMAKAFKAVETHLQCQIVADATDKYSLKGLLPNVSFFNWEPSNKYLCFGHFLEYIDSAKTKSVKFWAGLDIDPQNVRFILWFDKNNLPQGCCLRRNPPPVFQNADAIERAGNAIWVPFNDGHFLSFCTNPCAQSPLLENFIEDVLRAL
jgi:hypothetical protein